MYGGPGIGKSTTAALLYASIKNQLIHDQRDTKLELVQEYVKEWAWEGTNIRGYDQVYVFANQLRREEIPLRAGVDCIITDSPLILSCVYSSKNDVPGYQHLYGLAHTFESQYPSINILLDRGERPYVEHGRYQTYDDAILMDQYVEGQLKYHTIPYKKFLYNDIDGMKYYIMEHL